MAFALSLAEMASICPIAGAQYHWTALFAPPSVRVFGKRSLGERNLYVVLEFSSQIPPQERRSKAELSLGDICGVDHLHYYFEPFETPFQPHLLTFNI